MPLPKPYKRREKRYQRLLNIKKSPYGYRTLISEKNFLKVQQRARGLGVQLHAIDYDGFELRFLVQSGTYPDKKYTVIVQLNSLEPTDIVAGKNVAEVLRSAKLKCYCTCPAWLFWGYAYKAWSFGYGIYPERRFPHIRNPHLKGHLCFKAGTRVITNHGLIPIEDIRVGDYVFSHTGEMRKVLACSSHEVEKVVTLRANRQTITCTPEHKLLACPHNPRTRSSKGQPWDQTDWRPVEELQLNDYLFRRNIKLPQTIDVDQNLAWLLGFYLANGTTARRSIKGTGFTKNYREGNIVFKSLPLFCNASKIDAYCAEFDRRWIPYRVGKSENGGVKTIYIKDDALIEFVVTRGRYTCKKTGEAKRIPEEVLRWNKEAKNALIAGFFFGDGMMGCGTSKKTGRKQPFYVRFYNTNFQIIGMLYTLLCEEYMPRLLPVKSSSSFPNKKQLYTITLCGNDAVKWAARNKEALTVKKTTFDPESVSNQKDFWINEMRPVAVKYMRDVVGPTIVHNIQVEGDESYIIEGQIISKNCKHLYAVLSTFPFIVGSIGQKMKKYWTEEQAKQIEEQLDKALKKVDVKELPDI